MLFTKRFRILNGFQEASDAWVRCITNALDDIIKHNGGWREWGKQDGVR